MRLENLVQEPFLVPEVVIKLLLTGIRRLDNIIRAVGVNAIFVEQVETQTSDQSIKDALTRTARRS